MNDLKRHKSSVEDELELLQYRSDNRDMEAKWSRPWATKRILSNTEFMHLLTFLKLNNSRAQLVLDDYNTYLRRNRYSNISFVRWYVTYNSPASALNCF